MPRRKNNMTTAELRQHLLDSSEPVTESGCWIWTMSLHRLGYGQVMVARRNTKAHRLAYELFVGPIPDGLQVCHTCDTPPCINPAHLFLGTFADNMRDKVWKGRQAKGEAQGHAKFTEAAVLEVRQLYAAGGVSQRALAAVFGVSQRAIGRALTRRTWSHI